jgi:hypothetical protein
MNGYDNTIEEFTTVAADLAKLRIDNASAAKQSELCSTAEQNASKESVALFDLRRATDAELAALVKQVEEQLAKMKVDLELEKKLEVVLMETIAKSIVNINMFNNQAKKCQLGIAGKKAIIEKLAKCVQP